MITDLSRPVTEPVPAPENEAFWQAAAEERLLLRHCRQCGKAHWYPRSICPLCFSSDTHWLESQGNGRIYSYSIMRKANPPYAIAYVRLAEGPIMLSNIVDTEFDKLSIEAAVRVCFKRTPGGFVLPQFVVLDPP